MLDVDAEDLLKERNDWEDRFQRSVVLVSQDPGLVLKFRNPKCPRKEASSTPRPSNATKLVWGVTARALHMASGVVWPRLARPG